MTSPGAIPPGPVMRATTRPCRIPWFPVSTAERRDTGSAAPGVLTRTRGHDPDSADEGGKSSRFRNTTGEAAQLYSALHAAKEPRILIGSGSVALPAAAAAKAPAAVVGYSVRAASVSAAASLGP